MAAALSVPKDVATAWEAKRVAGTVPSGGEDDLRSLDSNNERVLGLNVHIRCRVSYLMTSSLRLSSIPTGPMSIQGGGFDRSNGIQCLRCLELPVSRRTVTLLTESIRSRRVSFLILLCRGW